MPVNKHNGTGSLPFCFQTIQVVRCPVGPHFTEMKGYPASPKTIEEMIRKRRLDAKRSIDQCLARETGNTTEAAARCDEPSLPIVSIVFESLDFLNGVSVEPFASRLG
jgi:hypothetical protein